MLPRELDRATKLISVLGHRSVELLDGTVDSEKVRPVIERSQHDALVVARPYGSRQVSCLCNGGRGREAEGPQSGLDSPYRFGEGPEAEADDLSQRRGGVLLRTIAGELVQLLGQIDSALEGNRLVGGTERRTTKRLHALEERQEAVVGGTRDPVTAEHHLQLAGTDPRRQNQLDGVYMPPVRRASESLGERLSTRILPIAMTLGDPIDDKLQRPILDLDLVTVGGVFQESHSGLPKRIW